MRESSNHYNGCNCIQLVLQLEPAVRLEDRDVGAVAPLDSPSTLSGNIKEG